MDLTTIYSARKTILCSLASLAVLLAGCEKQQEIIPVMRVSLDSTWAELREGESITLTATILPSDATNKNLIWESEFPEVVTVEDGKVTALPLGRKENSHVKITVTSEDGGHSAICYVQVISVYVPVEKINLNKTTLEMTVGDTFTLTSNVWPEDASVKHVSWSSTDEHVARVDQNGLVTGMGSGIAKIIASAGGVIGECEVKVSNPVHSVSISPSELTLMKGESAKLSASVSPDHADEVQIIWTSSDESVAMVGQSGKVIALKSGTAIIKASAGNASGLCKITVLNPAESVSLDRSSISLKKGESVLLTATVYPADADERTISWSSSDVSIATVDDGGMVKACKSGAAEITAAVGRVSAVCKVEVSNPVESIVLDHTELTLEKGRTAVLNATVYPEDADNKDITWSSLDNSVAVVDGVGTVTATGNGTTEITATAGGVKATCVVAVSTPVESISLDRTSITLLVEESAKLIASVYPHDASNVDIEWSSSDSWIVSVENDGSIKANSTGTATITAKVGDKSASCSVLVLSTSPNAVNAHYYGGAVRIINGLIQYGSQLNFGVSNFSCETITVKSVQLIDGKDNSAGNVMTIGKDIAPGGSAAWTITIGLLGIHSPTAVFVFLFRGQEYSCSAQYWSFSPFGTSNAE